MQEQTKYLMRKKALENPSPRVMIRVNRRIEKERLQSNSLRPSRLGPEQAAVEFDRHCDHCGVLLVPTAIKHPLKDRFTYIFDQPCGCPEGEQAKVKSEAERIISEAEEKRQFKLSLYDRAGLNGRLQDSKFDNFLVRDDWTGSADVLARVRAYGQAYLENNLIRLTATGRTRHTPFLVLYGQWGTGKSHLAAAALHQALDARKRVYFRVWPDYLQRLQASWGDSHDGEKERDIIKEL